MKKHPPLKGVGCGGGSDKNTFIAVMTAGTLKGLRVTQFFTVNITLSLTGTLIYTLTDMEMVPLFVDIARTHWYVIKITIIMIDVACKCTCRIRYALYQNDCN